MPFFSYKAVNHKGAVIKGLVESADMDSAYSDIVSAGLNVVNIKRTNDYIASVANRFRARKVNRKDIIEFANNLSLMLKAGIPITTAVSDLAETTENKYFKEKLLSMLRMLILGSRFSDVIAENKLIFPDIFVRLVKVGEETGSIERSLSDAAVHLQRMEDLNATIKRALIYPVFAIITTMSALFFWLVYVLPKLISVFKEMGLELPIQTRILIYISNFCSSYWYLILLFPFAVFVFIKLLRQKKETRYYVDSWKIKMPIIKHIIYNKLLALFTEQMRILTVAGITVDRSLTIVAELIGNDVFTRAIDDSKESILAGSRISEALKKHKVFPPMVTRMIYVGETSGTLDEQFDYLSEFYLKKLDDVSQKLGKMIEPIIIGLIGIIFALIIVGLLFPIYELVSKLGK